MADITKQRRAVIARVLDGAGKASRERRKAAFDNAGVTPEAARALIDKVAHRASQIADADLAALATAGLSEDEIFEIVVCAALGQASRQYEGALAALDAATKAGG